MMNTDAIKKCIEALGEEGLKIIQIHSVWKGKVSTCKKARLLPVYKHLDAKICAVVHNEAIAKMGRPAVYAWHCDDFHDTCLSVKDEDGGNVPSGIYQDGVCFPYQEGLQVPTTPEFENAYKKIIEEKITSGWSRASLAQYPEIFFKKDEDKWQLFVKDKANDLLIRCLGEKFGYHSLLESQNTIACHNYWKSSKADRLEFRDLVYLWIKKEKVPECINRFNLEVKE